MSINDIFFTIEKWKRNVKIYGKCLRCHFVVHQKQLLCLESARSYSFGSFCLFDTFLLFFVYFFGFRKHNIFFLIIQFGEKKSKLHIHTKEMGRYCVRQTEWKDKHYIIQQFCGVWSFAAWKFFSFTKPIFRALNSFNNSTHRFFNYSIICQQIMTAAR